MAAAKHRWSKELRGLGGRAKYARERAGFGVREAADAIGIDNSSLSRLEAGQRLVDLDSLIALARLYDCSLDWLLTEAVPLPPRRGEPGSGPAGDRRRNRADADG